VHAICICPMLTTWFYHHTLLLWTILMMFMSMLWECVSELRTQTGLLFIPHMIHDNVEPRWKLLTGESQRNLEKMLPVCLPTISHRLNWVKTRADKVNGRLLTAWAMGQPGYKVNIHLKKKTNCPILSTIDVYVK
jgi:hypothetical protein